MDMSFEDLGDLPATSHNLIQNLDHFAITFLDMLREYTALQKVRMHENLHLATFFCQGSPQWFRAPTSQEDAPAKGHSHRLTTK